MSGVDRYVDLAALARSEETVRPPRRSWIRIVVPLAIVAAFALVLKDSLVELFRTRVEVTLAVPVRLEGDPADGGGRTAPRTVVVQAPGWVEPDPFPTHAPALAGGVVEEVLVQESDVVVKGDPVARLVADDARIARDIAAADHRLQEATLRLARVRAEIASERYDAALEVTESARVASARSEGSAAAAELQAASVREGEARVALAESEIQVQRELERAGASGVRQVEIAEAELETARGRLAALRADAEVARADADATAAGAERAARALELRFDDRLERDTTAAAVDAAEAELAHTRATLEAAELELARMTVVAPSAGVVLERFVAAGNALKPGGHVCSLYDPASLRVRVDVPQGDVRRLFVGQEAEVLADSRPDRPYRGEVLRIVQLADIQKVTLEAQVRILDADTLVRPDMLAQVRFYSAGDSGAAPGGSSASRVRVAVPARLVENGSVWVLDPVDRVARRREVELGGRSTDEDGQELVEVLSGFDLTLELIDAGRAALRGRDDGDGVPVTVVESAPGTKESGR